jgi:hypothetical protein
MLFPAVVVVRGRDRRGDRRHELGGAEGAGGGNEYRGEEDPESEARHGL